LRRFQEKQPKKSIDKADAVIHGATVRPLHYIPAITRSWGHGTSGVSQSIVPDFSTPSRAAKGLQPSLRGSL
jgi:hypothetical protein